MARLPSLPLLPGTLWSGEAALDRVLSMCQIELFDYLNWVQLSDWCLVELWATNSNTWNHITFLTHAELSEIELFNHLPVCKQKTDVWVVCYT